MPRWRRRFNESDLRRRLRAGCASALPLAAGALLCPIASPSLLSLLLSSPSRRKRKQGCLLYLPLPLILEPLYLIAFAAVGALAGLLAGLLGIGGGAVIVPALILLFTQLGFSDTWIPHQAVATSLATVVATGAASTWAHQRRGAVSWQLVLRLGPWILIGAWLGAWIAGWLPGLWLKRLFALFLLYNAVRMLRAAPPSLTFGLPSTPVLGGFATLFGALSALLGIGGGILIVPFLARHGVTMQRAVATSSACGVPLALAGTLGFVLSGWAREGLPAHSIGFIFWPAALSVMILSMPMATLGARLAHVLPTRTLRQIFGVLLLLVGLQLLLA